MKNKLISIFLIISLFSSVSVHGMCKINNIYMVVEQILQIVTELSESGIDVTCSGFDGLSAQISSFEAIALSQLNVIESSINALSFSSGEVLCMPISMPTTITVSGSYCLSQNIAGAITIDASNVTLDLNGYQVATGIIVTSGQNTVSITNGTVVGGSPGIWVQSECTNIRIQNVLVKNGTQGILFEAVDQGLIEHCTLTSNMTGLSLVGSNFINVVNTVATLNACAGFDLVSCTENCFTDCKAIATGLTNSTVFNNFVAGFVSMDGSQNIFERCIANGTQAPLTTDSNSLVAGFALLGTESCSKIIGCESANTNASNAGVTVPYGILLQGTLSDLVSVTGALSHGAITSVAWSPDGQYVAVGGFGITGGYGINNQVQIFQFDRVANALIGVSGALTSGDNVASVQWSPDGQYLAAGGFLYSGSNSLQIYSFDRINNALTLVAGALNPNLTPRSDLVQAVNWSPNGQYVAVGGKLFSTGYGFQIYSFDRVSNVLTAGPGALNPNFSPTQARTDDVATLSWSPDGDYLAVGGVFFSIDYSFQIYNFDSSSNMLIPGPGAYNPNYNPGFGDSVSSVDWSSDGQYIAVGGALLSVSYGLQILNFNRVDSMLMNGPGSSVNSSAVDWSSDGQYVVSGSGSGLQLYDFDRASNLLVLGPEALSFADAVSWSLDGQYFAVSTSGLNNVQILTALQFPAQNVISSNTIYCNGHDVSSPFTGAVGVGISGTSICNMIIGNTAYNNPPTTSNFFVPSNYQFVTNVFNEAFGQGLNALQNISLNSCDPIIAPIDVGLLSQQILYNVTVCAPTPVFSAETISVSGIYCLSQNMTGNFLINTNGVSLDLNNYQVTGTITIANGVSQVTIKNGVINANGAASGILVNPGASNISISNVTIKNAITGMDFMSASNASISGCRLTQNITGLQLNSSYNVQVSDTVASSNMNAGFDLVSSFTNSFVNCKALSTGQNNTVIYNNEVLGFSSSNGYGNIFERCIANGTQALSTTDSNSLVAGFALRGTESCSKIISCESANANASNAGVTVPYGILLQGALDGTFNVTGALSYSTDQINTLDWSPDGRYVAIGGDLITDGYQDAGYQLQIFEFNMIINIFTPVAGALFDVSNDIVNSVNWSPDGQYVAVGGNNITDGYQNAGYQFQIFEFDRVNNNLTPVAGALSNVSNDVVNSVNWSPNGQYVAIGGQGITDGYPGNNQFQIFEFNRIANTLMPVAGAIKNPNDINSVNWSPDGQYVAVARSFAGVIGIYQFDESNNSLILIYSLAEDPFFSVDWSPDGQYLAAGGQGIGPSFANNFVIFEFDRIHNQLVSVAEIFFSTVSNAVYSVNWSPDGQYVAIGGEGITDGYPDNNQFQIFAFDRSNNNLTPVAGSLSDIANDFLTSVNWSRDGQYIAIGGGDITENSMNQLQIFTGIQFPSQNVITDNTVYCNGHDVSNPFTGAIGVGISGTSICNMIIGNTVYNNPPTSSNFFVPSNYQFVTNVFNQAFGQGPTALQNISLNACQPIVAPVDVGLLWQQILYLLQSVADHILI